MGEQNPTPWQRSAEEVLAVLLKEPGAYDRAKYELGLLSPDFPPGKCRDLFLAIDTLKRLNEPIHLAAVIDKCNGQGDQEWIGLRFIQYRPEIGGSVFDSNVKIIQSRGRSYSNLTSMNWAITQLKEAETEEERQQIIGDVITALGMESFSSVQDATAGAAGMRFEALLNSPPVKQIKTGISWIDNLTGGYELGEIWWIAAAYKMRKSSLMRNIAVNAARDGASVTIATLEGTQEIVIGQIVTMFAAEYLLNNRMYSERDKNGHPLNAISAKLLLRLRNNYKTWLDKRQVAAISYGIAQYKALGDKLRIYDATSKNGGLSDIESIRTMTMRDKEKYGCQLLFLDYLTRIKAKGATIFDRVSTMALDLQSLALKQNVALTVLAQRNEETIRGGGDDHSPGVKGGGDPAATADYLFLVEYGKGPDGQEDWDQMKLTLRLSRYGEAGKDVYLPIHAASGWILPSQSVDLKGF
jgi:replicative DNA helicase